MNSVSFVGHILQIDNVQHVMDWSILGVVDLGRVVVVLFDPEAQENKWGQFENVIAFHRDGTRSWTAELPTSETGDCYYRLSLEPGDKLTAGSFKSFTVVLDQATGKILDRVFTK